MVHWPGSWPVAAPAPRANQQISTARSRVMHTSSSEDTLRAAPRWRLMGSGATLRRGQRRGSPMGMITKRLRSNAVVKAVAKLCRQYLKWYNNPGFKFHRNGEGWLVAQLGDQGARSVFDVGANVGDWARLAAAQLPAATVYAFEIIPATFEQLVQATRDKPSVRCFNVGLGNEDGTLEMRYDPRSSAHATYTDYPWA